MNKKILFSVSILATIFSGFSCADSSENSLAWSDKNTPRLKKFIDNEVNSAKIPGVSVLIFDESENIFSYTVGMQNIEGKILLSAESWMHLGSNTKALTGLLAAKMVKNGSIDWSTKLVDVYPELKDQIDEDLLQADLRSLLNHTSGIAPKTSSNWRKCTSKEKSENVMQLRQHYVQCTTAEKPQKVDRYLYSNAGYIVAASMLEKTANLDWETLLKRHVCAPLKIKCEFGWPGKISPEYTIGYEKSFFGRFKPQNIKSYSLPAEFGPAGDVSMTIKDYRQFIREFLKGIKGRPSLLEKQDFEFLLYSGLGRTPGIGWGSFVNDEGLTISKHTGSAGPFYVKVILIKELGVAVTIMLNSDAEELAKNIEEYVFKLLF